MHVPGISGFLSSWRRPQQAYGAKPPPGALHLIRLRMSRRVACTNRFLTYPFLLAYPHRSRATRTRALRSGYQLSQWVIFWIGSRYAGLKFSRSEYATGISAACMTLA